MQGHPGFSHLAKHFSNTFQCRQINIFSSIKNNEEMTFFFQKEFCDFTNRTPQLFSIIYFSGNNAQLVTNNPDNILKRLNGLRKINNHTLLCQPLLQYSAYRCLSAPLFTSDDK